MRSGAIVRKVELWNKTTVKNNFGELTENWQKTKDIRAYVHRKSGKEVVENDEVFDLIRINIYVRNQHDIKHQDRIKYFGHMYEIDLIQPDFSERWLTIRATKINE